MDRIYDGPDDGVRDDFHLKLFVCRRERVEPDLRDLFIDARAVSADEHAKMVLSTSGGGAAGGLR